MRLILFDIDGTLLTCGPQVGPLFLSALEEVFGTRGATDGYSFAGKTDPQIVHDLMSAAGFAADEVTRSLPAVEHLYTSRLEERLDRDRMRLLPGVTEVLARLGGEPHREIGLLTGNWERGARSKLARFDLNRHFPFGAFGNDGIDRSDLPPVALERAAAATGSVYRPEETLIVGDTVHDVACAKAHGMPVLAVATGTTAAAELMAAGADWVVEDLEAAAPLLA